MRGLPAGMPIALAESIAPPRDGSRQPRRCTCIYAIAAARRSRCCRRPTRRCATSASSAAAELAELDLRPPITRFLERWRPGDPFVHLGALWTP